MNDVWLETGDRKAGYVSAQAPLIPVSDRGFTYGDGLFETVRVLNAKPLHLDRHLARLLAGLKELSIPARWDEAGLEARCRDLIARNGLADGVLRLTVSRGTGQRGFAPPLDPAPTLVVQTFAVGASQSEDSGLSAVLAPWRTDPANPLTRLKHLSCLERVLAKDYARRRSSNEALFINLNGHLTEATAANLFVVREGQVTTPPLSAGLLGGITRQLLLELAPNHNYRIIQADLAPHMLTSASEAFLTNAVTGILALTMVEGRPIGAGTIGPVTVALRAWYRQHCVQVSQS